MALVSSLGCDFEKCQMLGFGPFLGLLSFYLGRKAQSLGFGSIFFLYFLFFTLQFSSHVLHEVKLSSSDKSCLGCTMVSALDLESAVNIFLVSLFSLQN